MPYNGVGLFTSLGAPTFPAVPNTYILASYFNATMNDVFTGLSSVMTRDGQSPMTANLPMGANKIANLGIGTLAGDAVNFEQVFTSPTFTTPTLVSPALTGTPTTPTAAPGTDTTQVASTAFVLAQAMSTALPGQGGNAGKFIKTDGTTASWASINIDTTVTGTSQTAVAGAGYALANVAATTVTLPASPSLYDKVVVKPTNGLTTNLIDPNGETIEGVAGTMIIDNEYAVVSLQYLNGSWRLV